ncbi:hypothetical protein V2W45_1253986, partial [Cenococcum geophilum]
PVCYTDDCSTASGIAAYCVILTSLWLRNLGSFGPIPALQCLFLNTNGGRNEAVGSISYPGSGDFNYEDWLGSQITSFLVDAN